jgi:hypothetical protein
MKRLNYILFISLVLIVSCNPCEEVDCPYPFTEEEVKWIPYDVNDSLVFLELYSKDTLFYRITYKEKGKREPNEFSAPYCQSSCYYHFSVLGEYLFNHGTTTRFGFVMDKTLTELRLTSGGPKYKFNLSGAIIIDSLFINGLYIKDVYKYTCKPEQDEVSETYMHQGMGLVKIVFRTGQEFELVEHRKAK